jgi:two-component sensor histidine kinase
MNQRVAEQPSGTALVRQDVAPRIVSWSRSADHPTLFATSSQPVTDALQQWQWRTWITGLSALAVTAVLWVLAWFILRWTVARHEAEANALAVRDVDEQRGFGLKAVRSMLQSMGGRLTAANREAGTSFTVTIPTATLRKA